MENKTPFDSDKSLRMLKIVFPSKEEQDKLKNLSLIDRAGNILKILEEKKKTQKHSKETLDDVKKRKEKLIEKKNKSNIEEYEEKDLNRLTEQEVKLNEIININDTKIQRLRLYLEDILIHLEELKKSNTNIGKSISEFPSVPTTPIQKNKTKAKGKQTKKQKNKKTKKQKNKKTKKTKK